MILHFKLFWLQYTERLSKNGNEKIKQKAIAIVLIKNDGGLEYWAAVGMDRSMIWFRGKAHRYIWGINNRVIRNDVRVGKGYGKVSCDGSEKES